MNSGQIKHFIQRFYKVSFTSFFFVSLYNQIDVFIQSIWAKITLEDVFFSLFKDDQVSAK